MSHHKDTIILYHGGCPDGFGGAYAAWKKFGDDAEYIPVKHQRPAPHHLENADLYFVDFCYPKEIMDELVANAPSVTVLDHHEGTEQVVTSMPAYVYDKNHSGAVIAWMHFHPGTQVPTLLSYIEDGDLYRFTMPQSHEALSYIYTKPQTFEAWDALSAELENPDQRAASFMIGRTYSEHNTILMQQIADSAELVEFEGYEVYLASTSPQFASYVGNTLAKKKGPLALIAGVRADGIRVSLRGDGTVNVAEIAQRFGGNGHPNAAAFSLPFDAAIPWVPKQHDETPGA